mmetsp:Transcript_20275/g.22600  ORF Transcript_20275/g.22600 Transcript_20275/m.22600 type:complete len:84 (+) Transcript_20275:78-329(+)
MLNHACFYCKIQAENFNTCFYAASYLLQEAGKFPKHYNVSARRHEYEHTHNFRSKNQTFMTEQEKEKKRAARERRQQKKKVDQ